MIDEIEIRVGTPEAVRRDVDELYDEAFGAKISVAAPGRGKRLRLLADSLCLPFSVAALARGRLVGLAGFQTPRGSSTQGMTAGKLFRHLGVWGGTRASLVFSLYERKA
ncbi:MAG: hypothetical protein MI919_11540 [Holophagales bacterium]|nr:hypothetical protein [Holophagales bacterium]